VESVVSDKPPGINRSALLPRSGIGVDGPHLVIAPPGNPVIRLDARLLDRIELIGRSPKGALVVAGAAVAGVVAGVMWVLPGGVFTCAALGYLAHERISEARRRIRSRDLLLVLGDLEVALHVVDGPDAAKRIADRLAPYTRQAPITRPDVYQDARQRLHAQSRGRTEETLHRELAHGLVVGSDVVHVQGELLQVGTISFRIDEVREYALRGSNLPLPGGRLLQAAMGLLIVAAQERARTGEDLQALAERVSEYEAWTGRSAGR
jgi:hypothetical protein